MNNVTKRVKLGSIQSIRDFCFAMKSFPRNISIKAKCEDYEIDARSLLDLMVLSHNEPIDIVFESEEIIDIVELNKIIYPWEVE